MRSCVKILKDSAELSWLHGGFTPSFLSPVDVCVAVCWLSALQGVLADGGGSDRAAEGSDELGWMGEIESTRCGGPEHGMLGTLRGLYV